MLLSLRSSLTSHPIRLYSPTLTKQPWYSANRPDRPVPFVALQFFKKLWNRAIIERAGVDRRESYITDSKTRSIPYSVNEAV